MVTPHYVHVVDADGTRRAKIARELYARSIHAEIYDSVDDLVSRAPTHGTLLIADEKPADSEEALGTIRAQNSYLPVAFYAENPSPQQIVKAMLCGALDYLAWPFSSDTLDRSINRLRFHGEQFARVERRKAEARHVLSALTPRERDVLEGLLEGETNKGIAKKLGLSPRTVEIHRSNMMARLNAQSASDAVRIGIYAGLGT